MSAEGTDRFVRDSEKFEITHLRGCRLYIIVFKFIKVSFLSFALYGTDWKIFNVQYRHRNGALFVMENSKNKKERKKRNRNLKIVRKYFKTEENNVENFHLSISDLRLHEYALTYSIRFFKLNFIYILIGCSGSCFRIFLFVSAIISFLLHK